MKRTARERLAEVAADQWGLVTRRQLELAGLAPATLQRLTASRATLERVAHGVYLLAGSPVPDHLELRAAWLQLDPATPAWHRHGSTGVVSHRSAAAMYEIGHLPADRHEFTVEERKQTRRPDVRLHRRALPTGSWIMLRGLPVTRPARIASDLLHDGEDPQSVAQVVVDAIRPVYDYPPSFAAALAPHAVRFGFRRNDGTALLRYLLELIGDDHTAEWLEEARGDDDGRRGRSAPSVARIQAPTPGPG